MSSYKLTVGGPAGSADATEYTRLHSLEITETASSMNSWSATLTGSESFEDEIFAAVYCYYNNELIFKGEIDSYEIVYDDGTTSISGRGALVALDRQIDTITYTNTTVEDALTDYWGTTSYAATVTGGDFSVTIDEVELEGTKFEILQDLHELGGYQFVVDDYETMSVASYPIGTTASTPDWRIISSTRSIDSSNYANRVTVRGKRVDGTVNEATASDSDEITRLDNLGVGDDGVVEQFEKNTTISTQSEVDDRAQRFLEESVSELDASGSLEIAPMRVTPGYVYSVDPWDADGQLDEVSYSLGSGDSVSLDFDISGRIDAELIESKQIARTNTRSL